MVQPTRCVVKVLAAAVIGLAGWAPAAELTEQQDLASEVKQLRAEVQDLKSKQMSAADVDVIVRNVLDDADRRSTMLGSEGFTAGYDKGKFLIQSADGSFVMNPWLQLGFRNITNYREEGKNPNNRAAPAENNWDNGFELRRAKFGFSGSLFVPEFTYTANWATGRANGTPTLEEFWGRYQFADDWGVKAGQYKDPVAHEGLMSSKRLLPVERTYMQDKLAFGDNYIQGISLLYGGKANPVHIEVAWTDGANSANTNFQDGATPATPATGTPNYGTAGRIEWLATGDWKAYDQFTALDCKEDTLVFGAGVDYTEYPGGGTTGNPVANAGTIIHTADVQYVSPTGLGLYAAYLGRYTKYDYAFNNRNPDEAYDWGFMVQGNYMLNRQWELFARYDYTNFDGKTPPALFGVATYALERRFVHHVSEITAGVNYYIRGQAAKITFDAVWLPDGAPMADDGAGILSQTREGNQFVIRGQFQLLI